MAKNLEIIKPGSCDSKSGFLHLEQFSDSYKDR
jgi:hypothetical protein